MAAHGPDTVGHGDQTVDLKGHGEHHIVPLSKYYAVFGVLMIGLALTVVAAMFDLAAPWNWGIAVAVAVFKATCIVLVFMHVKYSSRLVQLLAVGAYLWLMILFVFTGMDYISRLDPEGVPVGNQTSTLTGQPVPGSHDSDVRTGEPPSASGSPATGSGTPGSSAGTPAAGQ